MDFAVRLYAEDEATVTEQRLRWAGEFSVDEQPTTGNGQRLAAPLTFFDCEVTGETM
jgi:hypothetical protein